VGDRHLKFYELRDNLATSCSRCTRQSRRPSGPSRCTLPPTSTRPSEAPSGGPGLPRIRPASVDLLVPDRVEEVQPPDLLTTRIYVDLVGKNTADARAALLAAARGARGKPIEEPEFPGPQRRSTLGSRAVPRFPGELPPVWNVPFQPNPFFTGRDQLLGELQTRLQAPKATVRRVVLTGLGGSARPRWPWNKPVVIRPA
jgi:hypothetical protein